MPYGVILDVVTQIFWGIITGFVTYKAGPGKNVFRDNVKFLQTVLFLTVFVVTLTATNFGLFSIFSLDIRILVTDHPIFYPLAAFGTLAYLNFPDKWKKRWKKKASEKLKKLVAKVKEAAKGMKPALPDFVPKPALVPVPIGSR